MFSVSSITEVEFLGLFVKVAHNEKAKVWLKICIHSSSFFQNIIVFVWKPILLGCLFFFKDVPAYLFDDKTKSDVLFFRSQVRRTNKSFANEEWITISSLTFKTDYLQPTFLPRLDLGGWRVISAPEPIPSPSTILSLLPWVLLNGSVC